MAQTDRIFHEGVNWLAHNTENDQIGDAIRLLAYLTDTTEEWIWQAVGRRQDEIAANDRLAQTANAPICDPLYGERMDSADLGEN